MPLFPRPLRTRVKWHRHALTASFADALPAMIWRWNRHELPAGFVLRNEQGQVHLRQHDAAGAEATLAVFPTAAKAEQALHLLSQNLLGPRSWWHWLFWLFAFIGLLTAGALAVGYVDTHRALVARPSAAGTAPPRAAGGTAPAMAPALPAAQAPVAPVPGTPVDVDQIYK